MNKFISVSLSIIALSGCATQKVEEGVRFLHGQKLKTAISYLGYPNSKLEVEGTTIYEWGYNNTFSTMQAVSQPFSGNVYSAGGYAGYSGSTTSYVPQTVRHHCAIRLMTDKKSIIVGSAWKGNPAGCRDYADALEPFLESRKAGGVK